MSPPNTDEPIQIIIPREAVLAGDPQEVLMGLNLFARSKTLGPQAQGKLRVGFSGFENDRRELWLIPEVRSFVAGLDKVFPYWFFMADLRSDTLFVLASCICRTIEVGPGQTILNPDDLTHFFERQFDGMNELWEFHALSDAANEKVTDQIVAYFGTRQILN